MRAYRRIVPGRAKRAAEGMQPLDGEGGDAGGARAAAPVTEALARVRRHRRRGRRLLLRRLHGDPGAARDQPVWPHAVRALLHPSDERDGRRARVSDVPRAAARRGRRDSAAEFGGIAVSGAGGAAAGRVHGIARRRGRHAARREPRC